MNDRTLDYLMKRMEDKRGSRDRTDGRGSYDRRDRESDMRSDREDYRHGNVDFEGSMDFRNSRDSRDFRDSRDYSDSRDRRDYRGRYDGHGEAPKLTKHDFKRWGSMMENFDGSHGYHYEMSHIDDVADKLRISFKDFSEKEFCAAVNMMYSDYGHVLKHYAKSSDEVLMACAEMAKAFLEDPDGPEPSEKLALYFHCIVDSE